MNPSHVGEPSPSPAPPTAKNPQTDAAGEPPLDTVEYRITESLKSYTVNMQVVWPVLEAARDTPESVTTTNPPDEGQPQGNGGADPAQGDDQRQKQVQDALRCLNRVMASHRETGEELEALYAQLGREVSSGSLDGEKMPTSVDPTSVNPFPIIPTPDGSATPDSAASDVAAREIDVFNVSTRVLRTINVQLHEVTAEIAKSSSGLDGAQSARILNAYERVEKGMEGLLRDALHDSRYALQGHGHREPVWFQRRLSIPKMSQDSPASQQILSSGGAGQTAGTNASHAGGQWTSAESSPNCFVDPAPMVDPMASSGGSPVRAPGKPRVHTGAITSADLPSVFGSSASESSQADSIRFHTALVPDIESHFQLLPQSQQRQTQDVLPSADQPAAASPDQDAGRTDNTSIPVVGSVEESATEPVSGSPPSTPSRPSTPGLWRSSSASSHCSTQSEEGDDKDPVTQAKNGRSSL